MRILYQLGFGLWYLLSLLPFKVLYAISDGLYYVVYHVVRYRRAVVQKNLLIAFPQKSEAERMAIEQRFYHFFCDYIFETIKLFSIPKERMMRHMTFENLEEFDRDLHVENKNFVFSFMAHYGNWEWITSIAYSMSQMGVHTGQIYHPLYNKAFDDLFLWLRGRCEGESIPMKNTLRRIIELKREGRKTVVGFISDQCPKWNSIHHFSNFFNTPTPVFIGTEQIAKKVDAAVYYAHITRPSRGYYHCRFEKLADHASDIPDYELTDLYMQKLEEMITDCPELWLWTHDRWKRTKEEWDVRRRMKKDV